MNANIYICIHFFLIHRAPEQLEILSRHPRENCTAVGLVQNTSVRSENPKNAFRSTLLYKSEPSVPVCTARENRLRDNLLEEWRIESDAHGFVCAI